jgi:hypothetical protein
VLDSRLPFEEAIDAMVAMFVPQLSDRAKPSRVRRARSCQCLVVGIGDDDQAQYTDLGRRYMAVEPARLMTVSVRGSPVRIGVLAHRRSGPRPTKLKPLRPANSTLVGVWVGYHSGG